MGNDQMTKLATLSASGCPARSGVDARGHATDSIGRRLRIAAAATGRWDDMKPREFRGANARGAW